MDDEIAKRAGAHRRAYLAASLRALDASINGALHVISGDPVEVLTRLKKSTVRLRFTALFLLHHMEMNLMRG